MNKKRIIYFLISIVLIVLGLVLSTTYRTHVYNNNINDFGLADTIGSLVSVISCCCMMWSIKEYSEKRKVKQIWLTTFIYAILWELLGLFGLYGTFDWKDIIAAIMSGIFTYLIMKLIENRSTTAQQCV